MFSLIFLSFSHFSDFFLTFFFCFFASCQKTKKQNDDYDGEESEQVFISRDIGRLSRTNIIIDHENAIKKGMPEISEISRIKPSQRSAQRSTQVICVF